MKTNRKLFFIGVLLVLSMALCSCKKTTPTATIKGISLDNNIAYNYTLSTTLTRADGFAKQLGVIAKDKPNDTEGELSASAALLVDITTGEVLYQKNPHTRLNPASTTKILTSIVALENAPLDKACYIDQESITWHEDNVWECGFRVGHNLVLEQALYGALVNSGNDAAAIVATTVSGSIDEFAKLMNQKARTIGATNSHFANPHGLTNPDHYTTAYDLYLIMNEAIKNDKFVEMSSTVKYSTTISNSKYSYNYSWTNGNYFINGSATAPNGMKVICGKTGYTNAAGYCLVIYSHSPTSGHDFISVILNAPNRNSLYNQMSYLLTLASEQ